MTAPTTSRLPGRSRTESGRAAAKGAAAKGARKGGARTARIVLSRVFASESPNFYLLFGTTLFLVLFGLTMVLSSSSVTSYVSSDDSFGGFYRQGGFALLGVPLMLVVSRLPLRFWKKATPLILGAGCLLQVLVVFTPLGYSVGGNTNWIRLGGFTMQPSELIKLGLALWLGILLARRYRGPKDWKDALIPVGIVGGGSILLVLIGGDLGTVVIMAGIVLAALFYANMRMRVILPIVLVGAVGAVLFAVSSENRLTRIMSFLGDCSNIEDYQNSCWQPVHGTWAMASGGIFGVGLGNSKAKWSWLPAADNDYIFAIIGEELGLIGAIVVLALFVVLAVAFFRVIHASTDPFVRIATGAIMVWLIGQAFVNIGVVLGVLPVLGVPLPLISSGGTALVSSLIAIGVVLSFARTQTAPLPVLGTGRRHGEAVGE